MHPFEKEGAIIGRLLAGYTTLELGLMNCVQVVRKDFDSVLKAMFRVRGETNRILIGDALARHYYHDHGLGTEFEMAMGAIRHCLKIRNQYAHFEWWNDNSGRLALADLVDIANQNAFIKDLASLPTFYVDVALLNDQEQYFVYTDKTLAWVNYERRYRAGDIKTNSVPKPTQLLQPALHLPGPLN